MHHAEPPELLRRLRLCRDLVPPMNKRVFNYPSNRKMQTEPPVQISTEHKTLMANCKNCFLSEKGLPGTLKKKKKKCISSTKKILCQLILLQIDKNPCLEKKVLLINQSQQSSLSKFSINWALYLSLNESASTSFQKW